MFNLYILNPLQMQLIFNFFLGAAIKGQKKSGFYEIIK